MLCKLRFDQLQFVLLGRMHIGSFQFPSGNVMKNVRGLNENER